MYSKTTNFLMKKKFLTKVVLEGAPWWPQSVQEEQRAR